MKTRENVLLCPKTSGVVFIDTQHVLLLNQANSLITQIESGELDGEMFHFMMSDFLDRIREHCSLEELWMTKTLYYNSESHFAEHKKYLSEVGKRLDEVAVNDVSGQRALVYFALGFGISHMNAADAAMRIHADKCGLNSEISEFKMNTVRYKCRPRPTRPVES